MRDSLRPIVNGCGVMSAPAVTARPSTPALERRLARALRSGHRGKQHALVQARRSRERGGEDVRLSPVPVLTLRRGGAASQRALIEQRRRWALSRRTQRSVEQLANIECKNWNAFCSVSRYGASCRRNSRPCTGPERHRGTIALSVAGSSAARRIVPELPPDVVDEACPPRLSRGVFRMFSDDRRSRVRRLGRCAARASRARRVLIALGLLVCAPSWRRRLVRSMVTFPRVLRANNAFRRRH